ncbi:MAG: glycogen debranching protein, partial [Candidatus Marinimicrobia bacterium]|nr:glycogen debranching protein [Candidatus Neomarinimicrobiota bacterium]
MKSVYAVIFLTVCLLGQSQLYHSEAFTITSEKVIQDSFEVAIASPTKITSNYQSPYKQPTERTVDFKFSINGGDNEQFPGEDHHAVLVPVGGKFTSLLYAFGQPDPIAPASLDSDLGIYLEKDTYFTVRADMRHVLAQFEDQGYYVTFDGGKIMADEFDGLYVAGGTSPLTWEFSSLISRPDLRLLDPDGDGIFETTVLIKQFQEAEPLHDGKVTWSLQEDISRFPQYQSTHVISDALYNLSLEELLTSIRNDGAFMAGAKWPGVWTRDISYSILLSLAMISPEEAKTSLRAKVDGERIIQDTGTGGSWPVSSDRMIWALAAWEIYCVTGDRDWLDYAYTIIKTSAEADLRAVYCPTTGLFRGESSFLDWREQTYPRWMDPKDIYTSQNLGTNAVHYRTYEVLAAMAEIQGDNAAEYREIATGIKAGMNKHLWMPDKGYYGQYLYGRSYLTLSPRSETLGEALAVLFNIANVEQRRQILANVPVLAYGTPCIFPQIPNIPPYHNNGIWPFVSAYWTWAAAKASNMAAVEHSIASIYRPASLFLTNKENMVAETGDYMGTEINSDRQLWSVAGNLAVVYRVLFGMSFTPDALTLAPVIPMGYDGIYTLSNFRYRDAILTIKIEGFSTEIASITLDGESISSPLIPSNLKGNHHIEIMMANNSPVPQAINLVENQTTPVAPSVFISDANLHWNPVEGANIYNIYRNGEHIGKSLTAMFPLLQSNVYAEYQVVAVDSNSLESFMSEPVEYITREKIRLEIQPDHQSMQTDIIGYTGKGYIELQKKLDQNIHFAVRIKQAGLYNIDFRYANGHGPINTNNKCAIRTLSLDGEIIGSVALPQRGVENWTDWGYSNANSTYLEKGRHRLSLIFTETDDNMNGTVNSALLDHARLT